MKDNRKIIVMAIDPGINHTGHSRLEYDPITGKVTVLEYDNFSADKIANKENRQDKKVYGSVISLMTYERLIEEVYQKYQPDFVCCEGAFVARFPQAFASLSLCINTIKRVLYTHQKLLYSIAPKEAKKAIGSGTADKDAVQVGIRTRPDLTILTPADKKIEDMVEHEADSIAIGYAFCKYTLPALIN